MRHSHRLRADWRTGWWGGTVLLALLALALAAPFMAPQDPADPLGFDPAAANHPPSLSWTYLLGADARGRSVLALLLWGSRVSLSIGIGAALLTAALGVILGAFSGWRGGVLDLLLGPVMDLGQAAPPLLILLVLAGRLGGLSAAVMLAVFALTGWVGPARLTRAAVVAGRRSPHVDAARAVGVGGLRLLVVHILLPALPALAAWLAAGAATYVALDAGLDFLGLGLPPTTTSWGTALAGAQDALAAGNWWWMACGGAALALATLSLGALARALARALEPVEPSRAGLPALAVPDLADEPAPVLAQLWQVPSGAAGTHRPLQARQGRPGMHAAAVLSVVCLAGATALGVQAARPGARALPRAAALLAAARAYPLTGGPGPAYHAYLATAVYAATAGLLRGRQIPWASWGPCPAGLSAPLCARSEVQLWYSAGRARALVEGSSAVCTPRQTWIFNPMAGVAQTDAHGCGVLGPELGNLGTTAGVINTLLPVIRSGQARVLGAEVVAGRRCWLVALARAGRLCVDAESGLALRVERLDRVGQPVASFTITALSYGYGLDPAPELFANPIPGGHGPLVGGLTQPLLDLQAADDVALFITLVPTAIPAGLTAQTPTFDSFYDQSRGYAPQQRVRQAYVDRAGRVALVLIETLPGSAWDVTPPARLARRVVSGGQRLLVWPATRGGSAVVRRESEAAQPGTAALVSSRVLPLAVLERVAANLR